MEDKQEKKSPHILGTSANLMGFCFVVLTSVKIANLQESTFIDEGASLAILLFMASCLLSFLALREKNAERLERMADLLFLGGLIVLLVITFLITANIIS